MGRIRSYLSYRETRLADQAKEDRAEADSTELESNSTIVHRWKTRLTAGPIRQRNREGGVRPLRPPGPAHVNAAREGEQACGGSGLRSSLGRPKLAEQANQAAKVRRVSDSFYFL
jgi:hypothetical protein